MVCAQTLMFPGKHCGGGEEVGKVTFILNTNTDILAAWLIAHWRAPHGASEGGSLQGQSLGRKNWPNQTKGVITLSADVILLSKPNNEGVQQAHPLPDAFKFVLQPLAAERVEVTAECRFHYGLLEDLARLLEEMARRWPELRDTLEYLPNYWYVENETQQKLLDAFRERLRRLKIKPGQRTQMYGRPIVGTPIAPMISPTNPAGERPKPPEPLTLQGKHPCGAVLHLADATAHDAATWLITRWQRDTPGNRWTWQVNYHHGRRHRTTPIKQAEDNNGRVLLTVGITEREANHPDPLSVLMRAYIPDDQSTLVQDNPRGLEVLLVPAGANLVEIEARCNAVLLLNDFIRLLDDARTLYGDRLRLVRPSYGVMDTPFPSGAYPSIDAFFREMANEYEKLVCRLNPAFAIGQAAPSTGAAEDAGDDGAAVNKLTRERLEYLRKDDNYRNKTDEELGIDMSLDADTVKKFRLKHGLRKRKEREQTKTPQTIPKQSP